MTEFKNNENTRQISGEIKYHNTKDVAEELGESESTLRFWCENFKDSVEVKRVGRNRKFTKHNIEQLKYIKSLLRDEGYSVEQVKEFLTKNETEIVEGGKTNEPLAIQALASAVFNVLEDKILDIFKEEENKRHGDLTVFANLIGEYQEKLLSEVSQKVNDSLAISTKSIEKLSESKEVSELKQDVATLKEQLEEQRELIEAQNKLISEQLEKNELSSKKAEERDMEVIGLVKRSLEPKEEVKKGLLGKIFGK